MLDELLCGVVQHQSVALPLVHGAWITALAFSVANGFILRTRLRVENAALAFPLCL